MNQHPVAGDRFTSANDGQLPTNRRVVRLRHRRPAQKSPYRIASGTEPKPRAHLSGTRLAIVGHQPRFVPVISAGPPEGRHRERRAEWLPAVVREHFAVLQRPCWLPLGRRRSSLREGFGWTGPAQAAATSIFSGWLQAGGCRGSLLRSGKRHVPHVSGRRLRRSGRPQQDLRRPPSLLAQWTPSADPASLSR